MEYKMEKLLENLGIEETQDAMEILDALQEKQIEYLERLDAVEDERRRTQLEEELKEIELAISSMSWMVKKNQTGMLRDKGEPQTKVAIVPAKKLEQRYQEAIEAWEKDEDIEAVQVIQELAVGGYVPAQCKLAHMLLNGRGMEKDVHAAVEWYEKAAERDDDVAQNNLGLLYQYGIGVEKNLTKAFEYYEQAASKGNATALYNMGNCYMTGEGRKQDFGNAESYYRKAAEQGHAEAQYRLGSLYLEGKGVPQSSREARKWIEKAAVQGCQAAQLDVSYMYETGIGGKKNEQKAKEYRRHGNA